MIWGFAWLTVIGTVVTLLPTLSATAISPTARARCTRALIVHCVGLALAMALYSVGLTRAAGVAQLLVVLAAVLIIQPVLATVMGRSPRLTTATVAVIAELLWMLTLCAGDAISAAVGAYPRTITLILLPAFLGAGLLQLVTGVLHHLLPILTGARPDTTERTGYARLLLINLGGLLTLLGATVAGLIMMGIGLAANVIAVGRAIYLKKRLEN